MLAREKHVNTRHRDGKKEMYRDKTLMDILVYVSLYRYHVSLPTRDDVTIDSDLKR